MRQQLLYIVYSIAQLTEGMPMIYVDVCGEVSDLREVCREIAQYVAHNQKTTVEVRWRDEQGDHKVVKDDKGWVKEEE